MTLIFVSALVSGTDTIKSSFKPSNNAKLYASPEDIQSVAYRSRASQQQSRPQVCSFSITKDIYFFYKIYLMLLIIARLFISL